MSKSSKITDLFLNSLKRESFPWRADRGVPINPRTGNLFSGINLLILDAAADQYKYRNKYWATYQQWYAMGFQVAKSQIGTNVVNWKPYQKTTDNIVEYFNLMKTYKVFNADQVFGIDLQKYLISKIEYSDYTQVNSFIAATGAQIEIDETCLFPRYEREPDKIIFPLRDKFIDEKQFVASKLHEICHWSESRTNWSGSEDQGELIAEITTGYLESLFQIPHDEDLKNCKKWLPKWIEAIEKNPHYLYEVAKILITCMKLPHKLEEN